MATVTSLSSGVLRSSEPAPVSVAYVLQTLNADAPEISDGISLLRRAAAYSFVEPIKPLSESLAVDPGSVDRVYMPAVLRDLRRRLDSMPTHEVEEVALDMMQELPVLASDYIGNTVVQVVFERSRFEVRDMMLRRLVPVFAATGTHKNGTWAIQKIIDLACTPRHYALIEKAIKPHLVSLLLDQFGNYVVQGCLKFGEPFSDFVYSGIATSLCKIAPSRFGARAIRAVLESEHTSPRHQRLVATALVQQISMLAHNSNGSLLVSWLLDSYEKSDPDTHARTHALVAAQLIPQHLTDLCTSKLGSGIILKIAASSSGPRVMDALLEPMTDRIPATLERVLSDQTGQGSTCIYRLLTTVLPPDSLERQVAVNKIRLCLLKPGAQVPNHKRLLEEVGLGILLQNEEEVVGGHSHSNSDSIGSIQNNAGGPLKTPSSVSLGELNEESTSSNSTHVLNPQAGRTTNHSQSSPAHGQHGQHGQHNQYNHHNQSNQHVSHGVPGSNLYSQNTHGLQSLYEQQASYGSAGPIGSAGSANSANSLNSTYSSVSGDTTLANHVPEKSTVEYEEYNASSSSSSSRHNSSAAPLTADLKFPAIVPVNYE